MFRKQIVKYFGTQLWILAFPVFLYASSQGAAPSAKASKTPTPSPTPAAVISPSPAPSPSLQSLTANVDTKSLLKEFTRAQSMELKALEHRNKFEWKELKAAQDFRQKEWEKAEKEARHQFFANHQKGPDRRTYIQDFIKRREIFRKHLIEEKTQKTHDHENHIARLKKEQAANLEQFKKLLDKKLIPPADLWPKVGG
jgi:hypothetical protein